MIIPCDDTVSEFDVAFVGDVFLQTRSGMEPPFSSEIESLFRQIPWVIANLETVLTENGQAQQKAYCSRADPTMAFYLKETGINAVNLANNHTYDYGAKGFRQTVSTLETAGISYFGVRKDGQQPPFVLWIDGCSICILGYTFGGVEEGAALLDEQQILQDIEDVRAQGVDRMIINLHWGEEYVAFPSPDQQRVARNLIDCGADVIIGHHPHVVQGIERYKEGIIFYSLGNFNFINSSNLDRLFPGTCWGLIILLRFPKSSPVEYSYIPVQVDDEYRPIFAPKNEIEHFLQYLALISKPLDPEIKYLFWYQEASWPHFRNHIASFIRRIRKYGMRHLYQMARWLVSPSNYGFYFGLAMKLASNVNRASKSPQCPWPLSQNAD